MSLPRAERRGEAVIVGVDIAAGHDGQAELVVRVRHENGVVAPVLLDGAAGFRLMEGPGDLAALVGQSWRDVLARTVLSDHNPLDATLEGP